MTAYYQTRKIDEDDDLCLADIMSLKLSSPTPKEQMMDNTKWYDWSAQNELYHHQQLQASYYQLQYLQQQQMMMMMRQTNTHSRRSSTVSSISSCNSSRPSFINQHHHLQLTPSSSSNSSRKHRFSDSSNHSRSTSRNSTHNTRSPSTEPPKRRQSLGKRIKKVLGMTETPMTTVEEKPKKKQTAELPKPVLSVDTISSASSLKKKVRTSMHAIAPDSPGSNISSKSYYNRGHDKSPSPASSTVSTASTQLTNISTASKKSLSFNPVIKLHETFSAHEYDRRCDTSATCQKLTPELALKIKDELNNFKLKDMFVHVESRKNTHFFM